MTKKLNQSYEEKEKQKAKDKERKRKSRSSKSEEQKIEPRLKANEGMRVYLLSKSTGEKDLGNLGTIERMQANRSAKINEERIKAN